MRGRQNLQMTPGKAIRKIREFDQDQQETEKRKLEETKKRKRDVQQAPVSIPTPELAPPSDDDVRAPVDNSLKKALKLPRRPSRDFVHRTARLMAHASVEGGWTDDEFALVLQQASAYRNDLIQNS